MTTSLPTVQDRELAAKWGSFLEDYCKAMVQQAAAEYPDTRSVTIPFNDLRLRDPDLANLLLERPNHVLRVGTQVLHQVDVTVEPKPRLHLRINGLPGHGNPFALRPLLPHQLRADHLNQFLQIEGMVKKVSEVLPQLHEAAFDCKTCGNRLRVVQDDEYVVEPTLCDGCEKPGPWDHREEESRWINHQKIYLQELPEQLSGGRTPESLAVYLADDLVQQILPGDRVVINGILQTTKRRENRQVQVAFNKVLTAVSIEIRQQTFADVEVSGDELRQIKAIAADPDLVAKLRRSFAPTIFGHDLIKDALLVSLFGGVTKEFADGSRIRGDIHVLLVGDPGLAKSQFLRYVTKLAPRAIYTSGKGATAAGLTAAAVRDPNDGQYCIEAGVMVLADQGIACIDEMDKMEKNDQSSMHQAMEQQEVSRSVAGVSATLKSRCAVIGAANPKMGRFSEFESISEQIDMPPALLSRFDFIFAVRDKPNKDADARLANHLSAMHTAGQLRMHRRAKGESAKYSREDEALYTRHIEPDIVPDILRKYVAWAKRNILPVYTPEAAELVNAFFVAIRETAKDGAIPMTARQHEALTRIAEANARMRLSDEITVKDAQRAIALVESCLRNVGVDPETGKFDIDVIATGISHSQGDRLRALYSLVCDLAKDSKKGYAREDDLIAAAAREPLKLFDREAVIRSLHTLKRNNQVYNKGGSGTYAPLNGKL